MTAGNVKKLVPKTPDFYQKLGCWVVQHSLEMSKSSSLIREKILEKWRNWAGWEPHEKGL